MEYQGFQTRINFHQLGARLQAGLNGLLPPSSLLLILDLHGVLVQRVKPDEKVMLAASRQQRPHWGKINRHYVWKRPYLREFFNMAAARYNLAIWSAAKEKNVVPLLEAISEDICLRPSLIDRFKFIALNEDCRPDPESGRYAVVKYLSDFWKQSSYTQRDTLIVDDTLSKVRFDLSSAIIVPEYNAENYQQSFNNDDTLLWLLLYLEYLVEESELDSNGPGILSARPKLLTFESFWSIGFQEASHTATEHQRENLKSLAFLYIPIIASEESREGSSDYKSGLRTEPGSARSSGTEQESAKSTDMKQLPVISSAKKSTKKRSAKRRAARKRKAAMAINKPN